MFGDDEVSEHVEGVAVRMHSHHLAVLLVNLEEPRIIQADDPHLRPLRASQADLLGTEKEAQGDGPGNVMPRTVSHLLPVLMTGITRVMASPTRS